VLPDLSVIFVLAAVILLAVVLDRVLFKPLLRVMRERAEAVSSAISLAERARAKAEAAASEFDAKVTAARTDLYKQMDERRMVAEGLGEKSSSRRRSSTSPRFRRPHSFFNASIWSILSLDSSRVRRRRDGGEVWVGG